MLKYNDLIAKLTDGQKIRILTGISDLSGKDLKILGIPRVNVGIMKNFLRDEFPRDSILSHSWDTALWEQVSREKMQKMRKEDVNFAVVPGAKIKFSPYRREISEDPYLATRMSKAFSKGASELCKLTARSGFYLTEADEKWMDSSPNERIINEYFINPYINSMTDSESGATLTDERNLGDEYKAAFAEAQTDIIESGGYLICSKGTDENTVELVRRGVICLEASANALESAVMKYKRLRQAEEGGSSSKDEIIEAVESGSAISDEVLDAALDKALSFIFDCQGGVKAEAEEPISEELAHRAILRSTVLLKNEGGILPLDKTKKIGLVGDIACGIENEHKVAELTQNFLIERGYRSAGIARGYDMQNFQNDSYVSESVGVCMSSDTVILFLGFGREVERQVAKAEKLTLPANQLYLADRLSKLGKKIIAVIAAGHAPDIEFTRHFHAVLISPLNVRSSAQALVEILCGEYNPSGKLAYTLYSGSETAFAKQMVYRKKYSMKTGPFIGYRYYDTAGLRVGYPFGHGLSYSSFGYSSLSVDKNKVTFTVENLSDIPGAEVAQIYVGKDSSCIVRPKKELCGFMRLELRPGESRRVSIEVDIPPVYSRGEYMIEDGSYTVYVGASVSDIRLTGKIYAHGDKPDSDGEKISDYLQSVSNVLEDKYTLEADYSLMKRSVKNILSGVGALALAISVAVFNAFTDASSVFLGVVSGLLAVGAIVFFILDGVERNRMHEEERKVIEEKNAELFDGAEMISVPNSERMFYDAFDEVEAVSEEEATVTEDFVDDSHAEFINTELRVADAADEFTRFALCRGFKLENGVAENLIASLATSRLIITSGLSSDDFNSVVKLLSQYFGTETYIDKANTSTVGGIGALLADDSQEGGSKNNLFLAMENAKLSPEKVHFAALDGVSSKYLSEYLLPFMKYITAPKASNDIVIYNEAGTNVGGAIAQNLWFAVNLAEGEGINNLPLPVARAAAVIKFAFVKTQVSDSLMLEHGFSSYQFDYMVEKEASKNQISEELWKKVDKLEKYTADSADYRIGNKLWLAIEKHIGMLMCGSMDANQIMDTTLAVRVLPSVAVALTGKLGKEDKTLLETLEFIFGEENVEASKSFINTLPAGFAEENGAAHADEVMAEQKPEAVSSSDSTEENNNDDKAELGVFRI
jgi:beta-glucosidase